MDTQYIKMADCPEIQDGHIRGDLDYLWCGKHEWLWKPGYSGLLECPSGCCMETPIWLPTQSNLQEMLPDVLDNALLKLPRYYEHEYNLFGNSMEQLWLAFYMSEKHNKKWEDKWVVI